MRKNRSASKNSLFRIKRFKKNRQFKGSAIIIVFALGLLIANLWFLHFFPVSGQINETGKEETAPPPADQSNSELKTGVEIGEGQDKNKDQGAVGDEDEAKLPQWTPAEVETHTNILLMGLDHKGMCDAVFIVSYDMETYESVIIALKRDTYIENQTWARDDSGMNHLAWANNRGMGRDDDYHAGARLTAITVEKLLGIELHAYASITFDGFVGLVDLIGGVEIDVDPAFAKKESNPLPVGDQVLDGEQALIYARHRMNPRIAEQGSISQDGDRVRRNQRLLRALFNQGKTLQKEEFLEIFDHLEDELYTSLDEWEILELLALLKTQDSDKIKTFVLPGEGKIVFQERINKDSYYFFLDKEESAIILQDLGLKREE